MVAISLLVYRWDLHKYETKKQMLSRNTILAIEYEDLQKIKSKLEQFEILISELEQKIAELDIEREEVIKKGLKPRNESAYNEIKDKHNEIEAFFRDKMQSYQASIKALAERENNYKKEYNTLPHPTIFYKNEVPRRLEPSEMMEEKPNKSL